MSYPILEISRESGDAALLMHDWTPAERALFLAMDSACVQLPEDTELEVYHDLVAQIGALHGLDAAMSIALWTRLTFSLFEPQAEPGSSHAENTDSSHAENTGSSHAENTDSSHAENTGSSSR